eukprot:Skav208032  [mRNA]  locus=scaffold316:7773:9383:+ [translate_table: standard]
MSNLALCVSLVAVAVATDLCGDAPCIEDSMLLQYKAAANTSEPNCMVDSPEVICQGVYHVDARGHMTGPEDFPLKAKKSRAKSASKSIPSPDCSCNQDQAFIISGFPAPPFGPVGYEGLVEELQKYFSDVIVLVSEFQADFQLTQKFPLDSPGPCLYVVWFNEFAVESDRLFLKIRAGQGATVLTNANFLTLSLALLLDFFDGTSADSIGPLENTCGTVQMQPSPQPGDTIAQALTAGVPSLPRGGIIHPINLALPSYAEVIWTDPVGGDTTFLREWGQGLLIWDGTVFVLSDLCGPLSLDIQNYLQNLVHAGFGST